MASPALFSNLVLASRRKRRIAPLPVSSKRSFSPSLRSAPSTEATVVRTSSPLSALGFLFGRWMLGTGSGGYVLGYCPGGYWFGYWFGGYWPGGYCPGGYWPGGYCPGGYCVWQRPEDTRMRRTGRIARAGPRTVRRVTVLPPSVVLRISERQRRSPARFPQVCAKTCANAPTRSLQPVEISDNFIWNRKCSPSISYADVSGSAPVALRRQTLENRRGHGPPARA